MLNFLRDSRQLRRSAVGSAAVVRRQGAALLVCWVFALLSPIAVAGGLPAVVDGEPLPSLAPMLERTTPAVVNISTTAEMPARANPLLDDPFFRHFFDLPQRRDRRTQSLGSGVIVDAAAGHIVTNQHVVENAQEILVTLTDGREFAASVVGQDPDADIAVIQIDAEDLTQLAWADSDALRVGDFVVAIGNPFGLGQTVTSGIVSALGRSGLGIEEIEDFIQTDASINPGNSGGALVNLRGELIGINTAIVGPSGGNVGIGFAIPGNMAQHLMQQIIYTGKVRRGKLGISVQELTSELQEVFKVERGVVVSAVENGSSAHFAGLQRGDVLVRIGKRKVSSVSDVRNAIGLLQIGQNVDLRFYREGELYETGMEVGEPEDSSLQGVDVASYLAGALFENAQTSAGRRYVRVAQVEPGSAITRFGIRADDIILRVNRAKVENVEDLAQAVGESADSTQMDVQRGGKAWTLLLQ